jgi:hypothetical protein
MPNSIEEIKEKYNINGSENSESQQPLSAQAQLDQRADRMERLMYENTNIGIDPAREVMRENVNLAGPSHSGLNYERYKNKRAYEDLGFNPYRNNEAYYNENSSSLDDILDARSQFGNLYDLGFTSVLGGKSDRQEAEEYARYSNIGSSTRGEGLLGFKTWNNAFLNSGYTIGLLTEIAAEEVALAVGAAATGGAGTPALLARSTYNAQKLAKVGSGMGSILKRIKNLKNAATAKTFWEGARNVGQAINPLRGTTEYLGAARAIDAADGVSQLAQAGKTFGAFYRDWREIRLAYDEAQLESGFINNTIKDDLIREHIKGKDGEPGKFPDATEMAKINKEAAQASVNGKAVNTALIYATNRISFGNVFNKYMPSKLRSGVTQLAGGKLVKNFKTKGFDGISGGGIFNYKSAINSAKHTFKNINKTPLRFAKAVGKYSRANVGEGIQEYFQEVIQDAETSMAKDRYTGALAGGAWQDALSNNAYMNQYSKSLDKYISEEGAEIFTGGFVMGLFAGPFSRGTQSITKEIGKHSKYFYDKEGYLKDMADSKSGKTEERFQAEVDRFNSMTDSQQEHLFDLIQMLQRQAQYRTQLDDDEAKGDKKSFTTTKDRALVRNILWAINMGGEDLLLEKIRDMGNMSEEDLNDAFSREEGKVKNLEGEELAARDASDLAAGYKESADKIYNRAQDIINFSKQYDKLFPMPVGVGAEDSDFGDPRAQRRHIEAARQEAKVFAIINQQDLVRSMERAKSIIDKISTKPPFWNKDKTPPASEVTRIFNAEDTENELDILDDLIATAEGIPAEDMTQVDKDNLKYNKDIYELLSQFAPVIKKYTDSLEEQAYTDNQAKQIEAAGELEVGNTLRYSYGTNQWGGEIIGESVDSKGRPQWKVKRESDGKTTRILKSSARIVTDSVDDEIEANTQLIADNTEALRELYKKYLKTVAAHNKNSLNETMFDESFEDFIDFYALKEDTKNLTQLVNELTNPGAHIALVEQFEKLRRSKFENMEETVKEQLELYSKSVWLNNLIQKLEDNYGVYVHQDELAALDKDKQMPEIFYKIRKIETNETLQPFSSTYLDVTKFIEDEMIEEGLIEPKPTKGHTVRPEENGTFSVLTPDGKVIDTSIKTKEEADEVKADRDGDLEKIRAEKEEPIKKSEEPVKKTTVVKKPITFDTPIEEWPAEVLKVAQQGLEAFNETLKNNGAPEIETLEDYLTQQAARLSGPLREAIQKYNDSIKEAPTTPVTKAGTEPPEEESGTITATQEEVLGQLDILKQRRVKTELTSKGYVYLKKLYQRVSNFIKGPLEYDSKNSVTNIKNALPIGNFMDEVGRVVFNNSDVTYEEFLTELESVSDEKKSGFTNINTEEYFNSTKEQVLLIKEALINKHGAKAVFFTDEIFISKELNIKDKPEYAGVGGVPDMMVIQENGEVHVYDFKNKFGNTGAIAKNKIENKFGTNDSDLEKWSKQQSAYSDLLAANGVTIASINAIVFPTQYEREEFEGELVEADIEGFKPAPTPVGSLTKDAFIAPLKYTKIIIEEVQAEEVPVATTPTKQGKAFPVGNAHPSTLSPGLESQVFNGEVKFLSLPSTADAQTGVDDFNAIVKPNKDGRILSKEGMGMKKDDVGKVLVISREKGEGKKEYVQLTYLGHMPYNEVDITDPLNQLDLKATRDEGSTGPYKNAVTINGVEYYAANSSIPGWISGEAKLQTFEVSEPFEKTAETSKDSPEAWKKAIETKFNNSKNIKQTFTEVMQDNARRQAEKRPALSTSEIKELYKKAEGKSAKNAVAEGFEIGDHYMVNSMEVEGKTVNFGTAVITDVTNTGITLQSTGVETKGMTKLINSEAMKDVIIQKIDKDTDIQAELAESISTEELKAVNDTSKSTEKFAKDASSIKKAIAEAKTKSKEEVLGNFKKKFGC